MLAQHPTCCGWVRRKTALQEVGAKIETKLKMGRSVSICNKIPCKLHPVFEILNYAYLSISCGTRSLWLHSDLRSVKHYRDLDLDL